MPPCSHATMPPCRHATRPPCHPATMPPSPHHPATPSTCHRRGGELFLTLQNYQKQGVRARSFRAGTVFGPFWIARARGVVKKSVFSSLVARARLDPDTSGDCCKKKYTNAPLFNPLFGRKLLVTVTFFDPPQFDRILLRSAAPGASF